MQANTKIPIRHGPKLGCQEAEAFSILEAEALTLFKLEAEALVMKPKPGYLYRTKYKSRHLESESGSKALVDHEAEASENHEAEARLSRI